MPKGRLGYNKWHVFAEHTGSNRFYAERILDGELEQVYKKAHCLACAKTEILVRYGGCVDLRGWHKQGLCGAFLVGMQTGVSSEENEETDA